MKSRIHDFQKLKVGWVVLSLQVEGPDIMWQLMWYWREYCLSSTLAKKKSFIWRRKVNFQYVWHTENSGTSSIITQGREQTSKVSSSQHCDKRKTGGTKTCVDTGRLQGTIIKCFVLTSNKPTLKGLWNNQEMWILTWALDDTRNLPLFC